MAAAAETGPARGEPSDSGVVDGYYSAMSDEKFGHMLKKIEGVAEPQKVTYLTKCGAEPSKYWPDLVYVGRAGKTVSSTMYSSVSPSCGGLDYTMPDGKIDRMITAGPRLLARLAHEAEAKKP